MVGLRFAFRPYALAGATLPAQSRAPHRPLTLTLLKPFHPPPTTAIILTKDSSMQTSIRASARRLAARLWTLPVAEYAGFGQPAVPAAEYFEHRRPIMAAGYKFPR